MRETGLQVRPYAVPCRPPFWARGGHGQTIASHVLPSPGRLLERSSTRHRTIDLGDGDQLLAFELPSDSPVRVVLMHGLSGDVNSEYLRRAAATFSARGTDVWAVNHRGCGEGAGLASRPYHSGRTEDLARVLTASREDAPEKLHVVVGFSLSGNLALLHAGRDAEARSERPPDAIVAVNPPIDLERSTHEIGSGFNRLYEMRFMRRLGADVRRRQRLGLLDEHYRVSAFMSLFEFDDLLTAPACGFENGLDYYRRCSAAPHLERIRVPTVVLSAKDDPFVPADVLRNTPRSERVHLHLEASGGHVGYLTRSGAFGAERWLDGPLVHYVDELVALVEAHPAADASAAG